MVFSKSIFEHVQPRLCQRQNLQEELENILQQHSLLQEEANAMRSELDRRNNTATQETQTDTGGPVMEEQLADAKKLHVTIEELLGCTSRSAFYDLCSLNVALPKESCGLITLDLLKILLYIK